MKRSHLEAEDHREQIEDLSNSHNRTKAAGLQQWFTPLSLASTLARTFRRTPTWVADLTAGGGNLLKPLTHAKRVAFEIDHQWIQQLAEEIDAYTVHMGEFWPYLQKSGFRPEAVVLNPPYGVTWKGTPWGNVDAQIACLHMACTWRCPGYALISDAIWPHLPDSIAERITAHATLDNVWSGADVTVRLIWWDTVAAPSTKDLGHFDFAGNGLAKLNDAIKRNYVETPTGRQIIDAADNRNRLRAAYRQYRRDRDRPHDASVEVFGSNTISVHPTPYEKYALQDTLDDADAHSILNLGKTTQGYLIMNPRVRKLLMRDDVRKVLSISDDALAVIRDAQNLNNAEIAPIRPLPAQQRLGFLESLDEIGCHTDWPEYGFRAGFKYPLRVRVQPNADSFKKTVQRKGEPTDVTFVRVSKSLEITITNPDDDTHAILHETPDDVATLEQYFDVPEVADIAQLDPGYGRNLDSLAEAGLVSTEQLSRLKGGNDGATGST